MRDSKDLQRESPPCSRSASDKKDLAHRHMNRSKSRHWLIRWSYTAASERIMVVTHGREGGGWDILAPESEQPFGIRVLMWISLFTSLFALMDLVSSIHPLYLPRYNFPETPAHRAISIVIGLSYAPLFYGIRRRLAVAWKFGWVVLIASFSSLIVEALASLKQIPQSGGWIASAVVTIGFAAVAIYWGSWWKRQKSYFIQPGL